MKRSLFPFLIASFLIAAVPLASGCGAIHPAPGTPVISLQDEGREAEALFDTLGKPPESGSVIIKFNEGDTLPVRFVIDTPMLELASQNTDLRFKRDVLVYVSPEAFALSADGETWTPIDDLTAVSKQFGMTNGTLDVGLEASEEHGPMLEAAIRAKPADSREPQQGVETVQSAWIS